MTLGNAACLGALVIVLSACHTPGGRTVKLSDATVVAAGKGGGAVLDRPRATVGKPLVEGALSASICVPGESLLERLGPTCNHESEGAASGDVGDLPPGLPPPARQVRWYCDERLVVRVVFESCDTNQDGTPDGVTPVEIGVATHAGGEKK